MEVLVTGSDGFAGRHLVSELLNNNINVVGTAIAAIPNVEDTETYKTIVCNLTDKNDVSKINLANTTAVIHLAALSSNASSFDEADKFISLNGAMTINLLETAVKQGSKARFVVISSGAVYDPAQPMPINEKGKTLASSPYVISKLLTENICDYYRQLGLDIVIVRPFNHIGPGQLRGFLLPDLAHEVAEATKTNSPLSIGNLKTRRDYSDVRDVVRAYRLLATTPSLKHSLYNICSGKSVQGEEILNLVVKSLGLKTPPKTIVDPTKLRSTDAEDIYGDNSLLKEDTGWSPKLTIEQSVQDFISALT
jgi:GDP-4-dehydro-6-deoxy-D-mannose reductase